MAQTWEDLEGIINEHGKSKWFEYLRRGNYQDWAILTKTFRELFDVFPKEAIKDYLISGKKSNLLLYSIVDSEYKQYFLPINKELTAELVRQLIIIRNNQHTVPKLYVLLGLKIFEHSQGSDELLLFELISIMNQIKKRERKVKEETEKRGRGRRGVSISVQDANDAFNYPDQAWTSAFLRYFPLDKLNSENIRKLIGQDQSVDNDVLIKIHNSLLSSDVSSELYSQLVEQLIINQIRDVKIDFSLIDEVKLIESLSIKIRDKWPHDWFNFIQKEFPEFAWKVIGHAAEWTEKLHLRKWYMHQWSKITSPKLFEAEINRLLIKHSCIGCKKRIGAYFPKFPEILGRYWKRYLEESDEELFQIVAMSLIIIGSNDIHDELINEHAQKYINPILDLGFKENTKNLPLVVLNLVQLAILANIDPEITKTAAKQAKNKLRFQAIDYSNLLINLLPIDERVSLLEGKNTFFDIVDPGFILETVINQLKAISEITKILEFVLEVLTKLVLSKKLESNYQLAWVLRIDEINLNNKLRKSIKNFYDSVIAEIDLNEPQDLSFLKSYSERFKNQNSWMILESIIKKNNPDIISWIAPYNFVLLERSNDFKILTSTFLVEKVAETQNYTAFNFLLTHIRNGLIQLNQVKSEQFSSILSCELHHYLQSSPEGQSKYSIPRLWSSSSRTIVQDINDLIDLYNRICTKKETIENFYSTDDNILEKVRRIPSYESLAIIFQLFESLSPQSEYDERDENGTELVKIIKSWLLILPQNLELFHLLKNNPEVVLIKNNNIYLQHCIDLIAEDKTGGSIIEFWANVGSDELRGLIYGLNLANHANSPLRTNVLTSYYSPNLPEGFKFGMIVSFSQVMKTMTDLVMEERGAHFRGSNFGRTFFYTPSDTENIMFLTLATYIETHDRSYPLIVDLANEWTLIQGKKEKLQFR